MQPAISDKIKDYKLRLKKKNISGLALDIDDTLAATFKFWIDELHKRHGNEEGLSPEEMLGKYRYLKEIPYWQTEEVYKWIVEQIESSEHQINLPLIKDSNHFVARIEKLVPIVAYISSRPDSTQAGTELWVKKHTFPDAPVFLRPRKLRHIDGIEWKAAVMDYLYPQVAGIIDDNPELVEKLPIGYKGKVYLYNFKDRIRDDLNVIPCDNWQDVLEKIKINHNGH